MTPDDAGPGPGNGSDYRMRGDVRPVPDPTLLTTAALEREVAALRELLEAKIDGERNVLETRLNGMDNAIILNQTAIDRIPSHVAATVKNLADLHGEKFASVQQQFVERDVRTEQTSRDSKVAVDAALQAAKEAVGAQSQASDRAIAKTEEATNKQLEQLGVLVRSQTGSLDGKITDLKDRFSLIEQTLASGAGLSSMVQANSDRLSTLEQAMATMRGRDNGVGMAWGALVAVAGIAFGAVGLAIALAR